jgi:monoterpene epsilon-lactone hydrolase
LRLGLANGKETPLSYLVAVLLIIVVLWLAAVLFMRGEDLGAFDLDDGTDGVRSIASAGKASSEHEKAAEALIDFGKQAARLPARKRLELIRRFMEDMSAGREYVSEFVPVDAGGVSAEWVLAPGADPSKRVLYIHGGAYMAGSSRSHRNITNRLSEICCAAVLAIDYRLMPENKRRDGIEDCRTAYRWILENGPAGENGSDGASSPDFLLVAGDSAGGNLSLSLAAWVRDEGLRPPDAVVAFSPTVDGGYSSPSIRSNVSSDLMLGPLFAILLKIPRAVRAWLYVLEFRFNPANPVVSPVFGDLSNLPPTLIQVSEDEMLLDDARRYVRKARASGSPALAQSWPHMLHVWQIFYPEVPEAGQAFREVALFLQDLNAID